MFARDISRHSVIFFRQGEVDKTTPSPFSMRPNGKKPFRVNILLPHARASLKKTPTGSTGPASLSGTLTHMLQATSAPLVQ